MKIGLVGLGRMGAAMAERLRRDDLDVLGWDQNAETNRKLAAGGLEIATNARDVASKCETMISIVTEDHGVRRIFSGPNGFLNAEVSGKLFIEMSTLQPMTGRELAAVVEAKGAYLIDSPVLGSVPQVKDGKLFALVGGRAEDLERARSVLAPLTRRIVHLGPNGSGYAMKLAVNLGLGSYIEALAESLALGAQQGLALDQMLDVLQEAPYASRWLTGKLDVLKGTQAEVTLDIRTLRKDIMSAVATGAISGVPMPLTAATLAALSAAVANGAGASDLAELPKFLRQSMLQKSD